MFRECFAAEKIHGSSSWIQWLSVPINGDATNCSESLTFFAGGASQEQFEKLFNKEQLIAQFKALQLHDATVFGEVYGGKMQGMSETYGKAMKFIAFEVRVGEHCWLNVPDAEEVVKQLGLEFVHYRKISTDVEALDAEMMLPSEQAFRNGCAVREDPTTYKKREGIVLRSPIEVRLNNGARVIAKHKRSDFQERKSQPRVTDTNKLKVLDDARAIADEWCTEMRLSHVLDQFKVENGKWAEMEDTGIVIKMMIADVLKESKNEIVDSKEARAAIGRKAAYLFKQRFIDALHVKKEVMEFSEKQETKCS